MADNDSTIIKPVNELQNITGLTPVKRREERKRRQNLHKGKHKQDEEQPDESIDEQDSNGEFAENNQNTIDYCA